MKKASAFPAELSRLLSAEEQPPRLPEAQRAALIERVLNASARRGPAALPWWRPRRVRPWPIAALLAACLAGTVWAGQSGRLWRRPITSVLPTAAQERAPRMAAVSVPPVPGSSSVPVVVPTAVATAAAPGLSAPSSTAVASVKRENPDAVEELAALERARVAQQRGDQAEALQAVEAHERRFPRSIFSEEREALRVSTLGKLGRTTEARARARAFARRFPRSIYISKLGPWLSE